MDFIKSSESSHSPLLVFATAGLLAILVAVPLTMGIFGKNQMPVEGKVALHLIFTYVWSYTHQISQTILITGGSEGMGLSAARQFSAKGANVVIISRSASKLDKALKELRAAAKSPSAQRFHAIPTDVAAPDYARDVVAQVVEWNHGAPPDIVWCIAGMSTPMLFHDDRVMPEMRREMDLNFFGASEMAHAILQVWWSPEQKYADRPRHLIFTASVLALYGIAGYTTYNPSKWALRGFADTLAQETLLYPEQPVKVHVVFPGTILSPGFEREQRFKPDVTLKLEEGDPKQTPDEVAQKAIAGLEAGKHYVTVGLLGEAMRWGALGSAKRNHALVDTIMMWLLTPIWLIVMWAIHGDIKKFAKAKGHPSTYPKKE